MSPDHSPVAYLTNHEFHNAMDDVIKNIHTYSDFLRSVDRLVLVRTVFNMLVMAVTCLKHEGFHEEREWRVIYFPMRLPSSLIEASTEIIAGVPQLLYKLPLDEAVSPVLDELGLSKMFDRLLIGPSPYPWVMYEAFIAVLAKAELQNPTSVSSCSNIPIHA
jgi:hypothetical protein